MSIFSHPDFDDHENVTFLSDARSGLKAFVAVHSTTLGPAAGGTRFWSYDSEAEGITDALRLSRAMSLKNAIAGIPHGGGKAVILRPKGRFDRQALFSAYGRGLNKIGGHYYTAEDVGVSPSDMSVIRTQTPFVAGLDEGEAASGDPSPITADGVFRCMQHAISRIFKGRSIRDITVGIQGLGHVGYNLAERLNRAGAQLVVTDINPDVLKKAQEEFGAKVVGLDDIYGAEVDVFAPCALGGAINEDTLPRIKAKVICGAANNQLRSASMGEAMMQRGILYCPDYVVNGGGIINVASELSGSYDLDWVDGKLGGLVETLSDIIDRSQKNRLSTQSVAEEMALARMR